MLELRPVCEQCNKALPPSSTEAMICSFECTYCRECAETVLHNVCKNCGGGLCPRPIRPAINHKNENYLEKHPATKNQIYRPTTTEEHEIFSAQLRHIKPEER